MRKESIIFVYRLDGYRKYSNVHNFINDEINEQEKSGCVLQEIIFVSSLNEIWCRYLMEVEK